VYAEYEDRVSLSFLSPPAFQYPMNMGKGFFLINLTLLFPQYLSLMLQCLAPKYPFMQQYINFITLRV